MYKFIYCFHNAFLLIKSQVEEEKPLQHFNT